MRETQPGHRGLYRLLLVLALLGACGKVTPENIEIWKGTVKGPGKLEDAVKSSSVEPALRAQAAIALEEIGSGDKVATALATMDEGDRAPLVTALIEAQTTRLVQADKAASARDSLVSVRQFVSPAARADVDANLLKAIQKQLSETGGLSGSNSLQKIVEDIGAPAAPMLANLMGEIKVNHLEITNLIEKVASPEIRDLASEKLVSILPKLPTIGPEHYQSLGLLAGAAAVQYLKGVLEKGQGDARVLAAQALQAKPHPELAEYLTNLAVGLAANPATPGLLRDEMFGLTETCCGEATRDGLIKIIAETKAGAGQDEETAEMVRYRAYEAALAVSGAAAIQPALEAFPAKGTYKREDVSDFLVKDISKVAARKGGAGAGPEAVKAALVAALKSASALARMTAILALETAGDKADAAALGGLSGDKAKLAGFDAASVGSEAQRVAKKLAGQ